jgi:hypothetical protein
MQIYVYDAFAIKLSSYTCYDIVLNYDTTPTSLFILFSLIDAPH